MLSVPAHADWEILFNPNPESIVAGYKVYESDVSGGPYTEAADCGKPLLGDILPGNDKAYLHCVVSAENLDRVYFVLTAYGPNYEGESNYSEEIRTPIIMSVPVMDEGVSLRRILTVTTTVVVQ